MSEHPFFCKQDHLIFWKSLVDTQLGWFCDTWQWHSCFSCSRQSFVGGRDSFLWLPRKPEEEKFVYWWDNQPNFLPCRKLNVGKNIKLKVSWSCFTFCCMFVMLSGVWQFGIVFGSILQVTGNTYLKDNISQYIRMQNNQMIICEEISAPPVDLTDIFATRVYATTSTSVWFQSSPLCYNGWTPTSWDELAGKLVELFQRLLWLSFRMDQALISH